MARSEPKRIIAEGYDSDGPAMTRRAPLIYVTGISGAGKTAVCDASNARGFRAFDADRDGFKSWYDRSIDERAADKRTWSNAMHRSSDGNMKSIEESWMRNARWRPWLRTSYGLPSPLDTETQTAWTEPGTGIARPAAPGFDVSIGTPARSSSSRASWARRTRSRLSVIAVCSRWVPDG